MSWCHFSYGGKPLPNKKSNETVDIRIRDVELPTYYKFHELKKKGKFSTWNALLKWLCNNKSLGETIFDEVTKRLKELGKEDQ